MLVVASSKYRPVTYRPSHRISLILSKINFSLNYLNFDFPEIPFSTNVESYRKSNCFSDSVRVVGIFQIERNQLKPTGDENRAIYEIIERNPSNPENEVYSA